MRILSAALAVLLASAPPAALAEDAALITVTGEGHVEARPDMATVTLGVVTQGANAAEAMAANSVQLAAVLERLRASGIEERDIQTSGLTLNANWQQTEIDPAPRIMGYQASNMLTVRVRKLDGLGPVLDQTIADGANTFNGLSFGLSDPAPSMNEARKRAVADAIARATLLTEAAGVTLGPVVSITEGGGYGAPAPMYRIEADAASPVPVAAGEVSSSASVTMVFKIGETGE
jgi:uncharacterized protein YggE